MSRRPRSTVTREAPLVPATSGHPAGALREAHVLAGVAGPGVVRVERIDPAEDGWALVLADADAPTLAEVLESGPLPPDAVVRLVTALARTVDRVHRTGHRHGSISADRIVVAEDGTPLLAGFGAAWSPLLDDGPAPDEAVDRHALVAVAGAAAGRPLEGAVDDGWRSAADVAEAVRKALRVEQPVRPRAHGPRPRAAQSPTVQPRDRSLVPWPLVGAIGGVGVLAVVVLIVLAGSALVVFGRRPARTAGSAVACAPPPAGAVVATQAPRADACPDWVTWSDGVITVPERPGRPAARYRLGSAGQQLLLAPWSCSGEATPALYDPATGAAYLYPEWGPAAPAVVQLEPGGVATASLISGCPRIAIAP